MDDATWTRRRWISAGGGLLCAMHAWRGASAADDAVGSPSGSSVDSSLAGDAVGEVAWLAEVQRRPCSAPPPDRALRLLLRDSQGRPIVNVAGWELQAARLREEWRRRLRPFWTWGAKRKPPVWTVVHEERLPGVLRQLVRYDSEPDWPTHAYVLRPEKPAGRRPGVVVFHPTVEESIREPAGLVGRKEMAFGLNLARRGCVALCPRNFLWPQDGRIDIPGQLARFRRRHPESKGMAKMLYDGLVAVDLLAGLPDVDPHRIGAIGHSLGAKEVLYAAAWDERIRASVSSEGGVGLTFTNWHDPWYLGQGVRRGEFEGDHHEMLALSAPRPFLLIGGDSADGVRSWPYIEAALAVYRLYAAPPRLGLLNHGQGHAMPAEAESRALEWLSTYL